MASSPYDSTSPCSIFSLPQELVEQSLIISAQDGFHSAAVSLGRSCKYFHRIVFQSGDNHLWREIFLTTFDDPRPVKTCIRGLTASGQMSEQNAFDWAGEFAQRLDAARFIHKLTQTSSNSVVGRQEVPPTSLLALRTLHSVLETAAPFPASPTMIDMTSSLPSVLPPVVFLRSLPIHLASRNGAWVERVLENGYPPQLAERIFAPIRRRTALGRRPHHNTAIWSDENWESSEEGRLFYKLVFLRGYKPGPSGSGESLDHDAVVSYEFGAAWNSTSPVPSGSRSDSPPVYSGHEFLTSDMDMVFSERLSEANEWRGASARALARRRVYRLQYLTRHRCWGPFMRLPSKMRPEDHSPNAISPAACEEDNSEDDEESGFARLVEIQVRNGMSEDGDPDYVPSDFASEDGDGDEFDVSPLLDFFDFNDGNARPTFVFPPPHQVKPDYAFLSAARFLVEENLKEVLETTLDGLPNPDGAGMSGMSVTKILDAFASLDLIRMGGAPNFWSGSRENSGGEGKGKAKDDGQVQGWDWAGVAGEWRRGVCWLDYHDLVVHSIEDSGIPDEDLMETMRIFPMSLRVSGYSNPPIPNPDYPVPEDDFESLIWKLPIIHVEGESQGSDLDEHSKRFVKGTVRLIGDGAVRWSLTSSYPEISDPEWVTEGVQVGSIGSGVGIIGMWTGADHLRTDPLGPFWAWKVS